MGFRFRVLLRFEPRPITNPMESIYLSGRPVNLPAATATETPLLQRILLMQYSKLSAVYSRGLCGCSQLLHRRWRVSSILGIKNLGCSVADGLAFWFSVSDFTTTRPKSVCMLSY